MVKSERIQAEQVQPVPGSAWLIGIAALLLPGLGHLLLRRWYRAILMGGTVFACFIIGLAMGGRLFGVSTDGSWVVLQVVPMIGNVGTGLLYVVCWLFDYGFRDDAAQAARATYEYGNIFLLIAGLLNYLNMLDAFDIAAGRKP